MKRTPEKKRKGRTKIQVDVSKRGQRDDPGTINGKKGKK